ncbi:SMP-30/gluconolactonase/LRE family protein [Allonocardiopsis opalescens]|uniref:Gluconolactonase n=1 Tax=Allonocardiopsis opalescens TaxID=1144618 RepID=A0A2T0PTU2_9ACTN|nr:SMP-30/gluconolactonase/LRE family protein [Allonocardiopsis opalescens]PRX92325.1 gluconolactonase [Allonocardiopsis opalescens]
MTSTDPDIRDAPSAGRGTPARRGRRWPRRLLLTALALLAAVPLLAAVLLVTLPSPIGNPVAWDPAPAPPREGALARNEALAGAELLGDGQLRFPEDLTFDARGDLYTGTVDGMVWRLDPQDPTTPAERFADLGHPVLGLRFDATGQLLAAVPELGLVAVDPDGGHRVLTDEVDGSPITYANELTISNGGLVYFSDSSSAHDAGWPYDFLEGRPHGRLLSYDPATGTTAVVADDLYFPNGLVLSPDEDFLVFAETFRYRLTRLWLTGPQAGSTETFADNLPLAPDNISLGPDGSYWLGGGGGQRSDLQDFLHRNAWAKDALATFLPFDTLRGLPESGSQGFVTRLAPDGTVLAGYDDPTGRVHAVSSVESFGEHLYLGTLYGDAIGRVPLTQVETAS